VANLAEFRASASLRRLNGDHACEQFFPFFPSLPLSPSSARMYPFAALDPPQPLWRRQCAQSQTCPRGGRSGSGVGENRPGPAKTQLEVDGSYSLRSFLPPAMSSKPQILIAGTIHFAQKEVAALESRYQITASFVNIRPPHAPRAHFSSVCRALPRPPARPFSKIANLAVSTPELPLFTPTTRLHWVRSTRS
jgi:hypothetical protein